jgi:hypothetical protein
MNMCNELFLNDELSSIIARDLGSIRAVRPVGIARKTCIVETQATTIVVKRLDYTRSPQQYAQLFNQIAEESLPLAPSLLQTVQLPEYWYALFAYVEGYVPSSNDPKWDSLWRSAFDLLVRIREMGDIVPEWMLESMWLERLSRFDFLYAPARSLLENLLQISPTGVRTLAHGDFSGQNLLWTPDGLILLDWEEVGSAYPGFDAGWLLALNRVGSGPQLAQAAMFNDFIGRGFPEENLYWFESLGLLRLLYRAMTLPIEIRIWPIVVKTIRAIISDYVNCAP